eukprot:4618469-Pyramimonas_sp.AAC.1
MLDSLVEAADENEQRYPQEYSNSVAALRLAGTEKHPIAVGICQSMVLLWMSGETPRLSPLGQRGAQP